jgi:hypothetical protein
VNSSLTKSALSESAQTIVVSDYFYHYEKLILIRSLTKRHGLELMSDYVSYIGALNQVVHLWRYDSLADMERKRAARDADPAWGEFLSLTEGTLLRQEDKVMRPTSFSPIR